MDDDGFADVEEPLETRGAGLWLVPSAGLVTPGLALGASLDFATPSGYLVTALASEAAEPCGICWDDPPECLKVAGLLLGRRVRDRLGYHAWAVGLGRTWGTKRGRLLDSNACDWFCQDHYREYAAVKVRTPAVLLQWEAMFATPFIGFGVVLRFNANPEMPGAGAMLAVPIGVIRPW